MARIPDEVSEAGRRLMSSLEQENADLGSLLEQAPTEPYPPTRRGVRHHRSRDLSRQRQGRSICLSLPSRL
eukprot:scaffold1072_cov356-Prasinococcus_capsulatus_cf.AAC.12